VPQAIFALPLLVFAIVALRRRDWILVAGVLIALPIFCICFLGFRWNRQHLLPTRIRVVSYNIEQLQNGAASLRFAAQQSPDILCLQESHASTHVADPVPRVRRIFPRWNATRYGELVTLTRHKVLRHAIHRLPTRVGAGILETVILVRGRPLTVFNVHFNIPINGLSGLRPSVMHETAVIRRQQLELLQNLTRRCRTDFVVAGDFNTPSRGPFYRELSTRYRDSFAVAGRGFGNTWHAKFPVSRIDYIFLSQKLRPLKCKVLNLQGSDHRPVLCEVEIR
jgi:endonuclease/exonuclease/phosphatase (EEP) superfamily protein YafD